MGSHYIPWLEWSFWRYTLLFSGNCIYLTSIPTHTPFTSHFDSLSSHGIHSGKPTWNIHETSKVRTVFLSLIVVAWWILKTEHLNTGPQVVISTRNIIINQFLWVRQTQMISKLWPDSCFPNIIETEIHVVHTFDYTSRVRTAPWSRCALHPSKSTKIWKNSEVYFSFHGRPWIFHVCSTLLWLFDPNRCCFRS